MTESDPKWTVLIGQSGRSRESGRSVQKWTVLSQMVCLLSQSWRSWTIVDGLLSQGGWFWAKVDDHLHGKGRSRVKKVDGPKSIKLDGPEIWKWMVQKSERGRSKSMKVDGPNNQIVCERGRSTSMKVNCHKNPIFGQTIITRTLSP